MFLSWVRPRSWTARSSCPLNLPIGVLGEADRVGFGDPLEPSGDIDPVAHEVAVRLLDHVAEMDADAEFDAAVFRHARIAFDHAVLHLDCAAHGVDHAAELDDAAVAGALDDAAVMGGNGGVDESAGLSSARACDPHPSPRAGCSRRYPRPESPRFYAFPPWRILWASLRIARKPAHCGVYSCLTCAPASTAANSVCDSAISGISGVGENHSRAGARTGLGFGQAAGH